MTAASAALSSPEEEREGEGRDASSARSLAGEGGPLPAEERVSHLERAVLH